MTIATPPSPAPRPLQADDGTPADGISRRLALVTLVVGLALVAVARWNMLAVPFERDEGEYAVMAQTILRGDLPYVAAYNMKLPGVYYSYAAIFALFGQTDFDVHLALLLMTTLSAVGVAWLGYRLISPWGAAVASVSFAALSASERVYGFTANAEHFVVFWFVAALVVGAWATTGPVPGTPCRRTPPVRSLALFASGICLGLSFLMKQHALLLILFGALWAAGRLVNDWRSPSLRRERATEGLLLAVGILLPYLLILGYFAVRGGLDRFWFWTVAYARHYVSERTLAEGVSNLVRTGSHVAVSAWPIGLLALCGVVGLVGSTRPVAVKAGWLALGACSFLTTTPGLLFREHYVLMALPALGLLAGWGVEALSRRFGSSSTGTRDPLDERARFTATTLIPAGLTVVALGYLLLVESPVWMLSPVDLSRYAFGQNPFPEAVTIARELRQRTSASDTLAVIGSEPQIYFYADRRPATGYLYTYPLMEHHPYAESMHDEFIRDLEERKPAYVVLVLVPTSWLATKTSVGKLLDWTDARLPALYTLVGVANIPAQGQASDFYWDNPELARLSRSDFPLQIWKRK